MSDEIPVGSGIYQIVNTVSGKRYIGSAVNLRKRWTEHRRRLNGNCHINVYLQASWSKHGEDVFEFSIIERVANKKDLLAREQATLDALKPEYNLCPTAGSMLGYKFTEDQVAKLSAAGKIMWADPDYRQKVTSSTKSLWNDPVYRSKNCATRKVVWTDAGRLVKRGNAIRTALADPAIKKKLSLARKSSWAEPQYRIEISAKRKAAWSDPDYCAVRSAASKASWSDQKFREKIAATRKVLWSDPAHRAKMSDVRKADWARRRAKKEGVNG